MWSVVDRKFVMRRIPALERYPFRTFPKAPNSPEVFVPFLGFSKQLPGQYLNRCHHGLLLNPSQNHYSKSA